MKKTRYFIFALGVVLTLFSQIGLGQSKKAKKIDEFIKPFAAANQFSGLGGFLATLVLSATKQQRSKR